MTLTCFAASHCRTACRANPSLLHGVPPAAGRNHHASRHRGTPTIRRRMFRFSTSGVRQLSGLCKNNLGFAVLLPLLAAGGSYAQVDPGIRGGAPGAGQPFVTGLTPGELAFFNGPAKTEFTEEE